MNKRFRLSAKNCGPLAQWLFPDLPEDLCLFDADGRCILYTQTHESVCEFYCETEKEPLSEWGISFDIFEIEETEIPLLAEM